MLGVEDIKWLLDYLEVGRIECENVLGKSFFLFFMELKFLRIKDVELMWFYCFYFWGEK